MKIILPDGTIEHRNKGILHNPLGPAVIYLDGGVEYWIDGNPHRTDGPAFISGELEEWWFQGRCHRIEGPAVRWLKTGMDQQRIILHLFLDVPQSSTRFEVSWFSREDPAGGYPPAPESRTV